MVIKRTNAHNFVQKQTFTHSHTYTHITHLQTPLGGIQIEEVDDKKPSKDEKVSATKTVKSEEDTIPDKEAEQLAAPEEKPTKRRSIGEKKPKKEEPKKEEPEKVEPSIDEPDHIQVDTVNENDLKPSSKPSSRRGSKKDEPSSEPKTIEVQTLRAAIEMAFFKAFRQFIFSNYASLDLWPLTNTINHTPTLDTDKTNSLTHLNLQI